MAEIVKKKWFQIAAALVFVGAFIFFAKFWGKDSGFDTPNIAAQVGGMKITNFELQTAMNRRMLRIVTMKGRVSAADKQEVMLSVFKGLMNDALLREVAQKEGVTVTPADLEKKRMSMLRQLGYQDSVKKGNPMGEPDMDAAEKYLAALWNSLGFSSEADFLSDIKLELLEQKLADHLYPVKGYTIKNEEIEEYLPRVELQQIVLLFDSKQPQGMEINNAKQKLLQKANDLHAQLMNGANFDKLAKDNSQEEYALNGGRIGFINKRAVVPKMWEVASNMKPGEISQPFVSDFGVHIIKCLQRLEPDDKRLTDLRRYSKLQVMRRRQKSDFVMWFYRQMKEYEENDKIKLYNPVLLANKLRNMGKYDEAVEQYRKAIETDKETAPYYHVDIALIYARQRKYSESLREIRAATEKSPTDPKLFFALGETYMELGEHSKALNEFQQASRLSLLDYELHMRLENIYTQLGLTEEADKEHELYMKAMQTLGAEPGATPGGVFKYDKGPGTGAPRTGAPAAPPVPTVRDESEMRNYVEPPQDLQLQNR